MKRRTVLGLLITAIVCGTMIFSSVSAAEFVVPSDYLSTLNTKVQYEILDCNETGVNEWWTLTPSYRGDWETEIGSIWNFTLSDMEDDDGGFALENPIPYFDVLIADGHTANFTRSNISDSEIAVALSLGYQNFQPGLAIRMDRWAEYAQKAHAQSEVEQWWNPGNYDYADITVTNTTAFVTYKIEQTTGMRQNTTLTYSKDTGRLFYAKTQTSQYYWLEMQIKDGHERDVAGKVRYKVLDCNQSGVNEWWTVVYSYRGDWETEIGSIWNFTLSDLEDDDGGFALENPIPYFDMLIADNTVANFTATNISNSEIAVALGFGYMDFQPGLSVRVDRWDQLAQQAHAQVEVEQWWDPGTYDYADVTITNTSANVTYEIKQTTGMKQNTTLTYSRDTGRLLYAKTQSSEFYWLELELFDEFNGNDRGDGGIPGYLPSVIGIILAFSVFALVLKKKKKSTTII